MLQIFPLFCEIVQSSIIALIIWEQHNAVIAEVCIYQKLCSMCRDRCIWHIKELYPF